MVANFDGCMHARTDEKPDSFIVSCLSMRHKKTDKFVLFTIPQITSGLYHGIQIIYVGEFVPTSVTLLCLFLSHL